MALTNCPSCSKKISSKAAHCPHCNFQMEAASNEDIQRKLSLQRFKQHQRLQTQSMIAVILFIAGFAYMYMGSAARDQTQYQIAVAISVVGFIWYIINRVRIILHKRKD